MGDLFGLQDQAVASAEKMLDIRPSPSLAREPQAANAAAYDAYLRGRGYFDEYDKPENVDHAIEQFQEATRRDPKFAAAYAALGEAYEEKSIHPAVAPAFRAQAKTACETAAALAPSLTESHICLGAIRNDSGEYETAVDQYKLALARSPNSDAAYRGLGDAYAKLNRPADAAANFHAAILKRPNYWAGYSWLGAFYYSQGCLAQAAASFLEVTRLAPGNFWAYSNLGGAEIGQGHYSEARRAFEKSLSIRENEGGWNNLGIVNLTTRRFPEAAAAFEKALQINPKSYKAWGNLGQARYFTTGQRGAAPDAYRQAAALANDELRANPRSAAIHGSLARYYARLGERTAALDHLQTALAIAPNSIDILTKAALVDMQFGEKDAAIEALVRASDAGLTAGAIRDTPDFDPLRGDPRFQRLLEKNLSTATPVVCGKL
jgi:tetratricopeptide (TPR) repeat protein